MRRKLISALLASVLILSLVMTGWAAQSPQVILEAEKEAVGEGETFTVAVSLEANPGFEAIQIDVVYDTQTLTCIQIRQGELLTQEGALYAGNEDNEGKATFSAISVTSLEGDGVLAELTFRGEKAGSSPISAVIVRMISQGERISGSVIEDEVRVTGTENEKDEPDQSEQPEQPDSIPDTPEIHFTDVPQEHWAYPYVQNVVSRGLFSGVGGDQFGPDVPMTRAMFVTVLYRMAGSPQTQGVNFIDVADDAWYADGVAWASANGIVSGVGGGLFAPDQPVTREQLALILYQYAQGTSPGTEGVVRMFYPDGTKISDWALTAVAWAVNEGLISGKTGNLLDPQASATRAEVAVMMSHLA